MRNPRPQGPPFAPDTLSSGRALAALLVSATLVRLAPVLLWPRLPIIRDEVSYTVLAQALIDGQGIEPTAHGWLWAPLYPALLALHQILFGSFTSIRVTQALMGAASAFLVYRLGRRLGGDRAGLAAGWIYALEPTLVAFSHYLWTEHVYTLWLLLAVEGALWARDRRPMMSLLPGAALGLAVLTRGVATYALPFLLPAVLWGRVRDRRAWTSAACLSIAACLVVLPYSIYASRKYGGWVVSDTSIGFNMWLGNNAFEPVSFDYRMGGDTMSEEDYARLGGRKECWSGLSVVEKNRCEVENGLRFIAANPWLFVKRIGVREAQTFNPSSFLVRNLRWGRYEGLPDWLRSSLVVMVLGAHFLVVVTAALGAVAAGAAVRDRWGALGASGPASDVDMRSGGPAFQATAWALTLYHLAAAGALIGLSRFRVPLIPLWIPFSGLVLAWPTDALRRIYGRVGRGVFATALAVLVTALSIVYLSRAFLPPS